MQANTRIYLDNHATTPCDPRALAVMLPWFTEHFGNPASVEHALGQEAEQAVAAARAHVAALVNAETREIVFTSGATESNNIAIKGAARFAALHRPEAPRRLVTLATEHKCVLQSMEDLAREGFATEILPVRADGTLELDRLREALRTPTLLVSAMAANNESGVLHDLAAIAALCHAAGALLHSDVAQATAKIPLDVRAMDLDLLSISAHKMYGPKGIGALFVRHRPRVRLEPLFSGGGQERGLRSGTLPAPLIVGFGEAARLALADLETDAARIATLRDRLLAALRAGIPGLVVNGSLAARLPGNLNLTFPAARAPELLAACPELCLSTGSACSSAEITPSYVLTAMGVSAEAAARSLRICIGRFTSTAEVDLAAAALVRAHARLSNKARTEPCPQ